MIRILLALFTVVAMLAYASGLAWAMASAGMVP